MVISRAGKMRRLEYGQGFDLRWRSGFNLRGFFSSPRRLYRLLIISLAVIALVPPLFLHFRLTHFQRMQLRKCGWLNGPPLICAHGGDSTKSFPNTMASYHHALRFHIDCIEVDVSRTADGVLVALHDRDLQQITGNSTSKVGYMNWKEIKSLDVAQKLSQDFHDRKIPTLEEALTLISNSVRQVILDAKVGPPLYENGLAKDIVSVIKRARCLNCLVWAKSDSLVRDIVSLSVDVVAGYIVMRDPSTGARMKVLRMKKAQVVGVYHPLVNESLMRTLHHRGKKVYAWTVDDVNEMQRMLVEQVDGIVTGNPMLLRRLMQDTRTQCLLDGFPS